MRFPIFWLFSIVVVLHSFGGKSVDVGRSIMPDDDFKPSDFLEQKPLTRALVGKLRKAELESLVNYLDLGEVIKVHDLLKPAIVKQLCHQMLQLGLFGEDALQAYEKSRAQSQIEQQKLKAEQKKLELQATRDHEYRIRQLELQQADNQVDGASANAVRADTTGNHASSFSVVHQAKLVPKFNEREVDKYFMVSCYVGLKINGPCFCSKV